MGGALATFVKNAGVADQIAEVVMKSSFPPILIPIIIAALIHVITGSNALGVMTAAALVEPMLGTLGVSPIAAFLACGTGALMFKHANSSGFWVTVSITAMVECTGNTTIGSDAALIALQKGINVYMVSKETDSVTGTYMNQVAARNKAVYTLVNGDQPRNLLDLYSWAKLLGLEVICAGKSSEYDFVWDRETCEFTYKDGIHESELLPDMHKYWHYEGTQTLEGRDFLLKKYKETIAADLCEMTLVSNVSGLMPATPFMHYPIAKASELADIFIPKEDGGILDSTGVVDVFYNLREKDEASFCGGEFVIVRCKNAKSWDILASKGHVMSKNGKYCCIYLPYHFMGLETPVTILQGDFMGIGTHPETRQVTVMAGVAQKDLPAGTVLKVHGHHHQIDGLLPELLIRSNAKDAAPFYLLNNSILLRDVEEGQPVTLEDVDLSSHPAYALYLEGLKLDN